MIKNEDSANVMRITLKYLVLVLPLLLALILLNLAYALEHIPNYKSPLDNLFQVGLLFVIATSVASIGVEIQHDITIRNINSTQNTKINELEQRFNKKIDLLEANLTKIISEHESKISNDANIIEILRQLELVKSQLEKGRKKTDSKR